MDFLQRRQQRYTAYCPESRLPNQLLENINQTASLYFGDLICLYSNHVCIQVLQDYMNAF